MVKQHGCAEFRSPYELFVHLTATFLPHYNYFSVPVYMKHSLNNSFDIRVGLVEQTGFCFRTKCQLSNNNNNNNNNNRQRNKYQEMANEIFVMWKQKAAQVIPIVISSTAVIPKSLSQSLTKT